MTRSPSANSEAPFPESALYTKLGVSAAKADVEDAAQMLPPGLFPMAFCRIAPDVYQDDPEYCTVSHSDGAGSKSILAYLKFRQTGDASAFKRIAHDALVMNLDDMLCCGVTTGFAFVSIVNRHAQRVGKEVLTAIIEGTIDTIDELLKHGVQIVFSGGETADVGDVVQTILVEGALTARFKRDVVVRNEIKPGHLIVGLAGYGAPAVYERSWNSGIGSNGITLARRSLLSPKLTEQYPEIASASITEGSNYFGRWMSDDILPGFDATILDALLSPTRTYAPILHAFLPEHRSQVSGIFHNTGGGQVKSLKMALGVHIRKVIPMPFPPIFAEIQRSIGISAIEMAKVFNLGWRMEVYCEEVVALELIKLARSFNVDAVIIGHVAPGQAGRKRLTLTIGDDEVTFKA